MRCRIAIFTSDAFYEGAGAFLRGVRRACAETGAEAFLFSSFGNAAKDERNAGEENIYRLSDLKTFDACLINSFQLMKCDFQEELICKAAQSACPVLLIEQSRAGCSSVRSDDYHAMRRIVSHMIERHGARRLFYISGMNNFSSTERRRAFEDECNAHHIPDSDRRIISGKRLNSGGRLAVDEILEMREELPDAILCENDSLAAGVTSRFMEREIRVPDDIAVTGFGNMKSAKLSNPGITTAGIDMEQCGYHGILSLLDRIGEERDEHDEVLPIELVYRSSCGCKESFHAENVAMKSEYYETLEYIRNYQQLLSQITANLLRESDIQGIVTQIEDYAKKLDWERLLIVMNESYLRGYDSLETADCTDYDDSFVCMVDTRPENTPDSRHQYGKFKREELLPSAFRGEGSVHLFYPLHDKDVNIGFALIEGGTRAIELNLLESMLVLFGAAIDSRRRIHSLQNKTERLDQLYVKDSLTGIYNRFGFERFGRQLYERLRERRADVRIAFIDLDGMKKINDEFGHEAGDQAILTLTEIMKHLYGRREDVLVRYGGDEFLIMIEESGVSVAEHLYPAIAEVNRDGHYPFELQCSIGEVVLSTGEDKSLLDAIQQADREMYRIKKRKKAERG